jgi:hypothetical protein
VNATAVPTVSSLEETLTIPVVPHVTKFQDELSALLVNLRIMDDHGDDRDFIAQQFALQDQNGNGSIDFEEFKVRHLRARSPSRPGILSERHRPLSESQLSRISRLKAGKETRKSPAFFFFPPLTPEPEAMAKRESRIANRASDASSAFRR